MSPLPPIAILCGFLNIAAMLFGIELAFLPLLIVTCVIATIAWMHPGASDRRNARAMAIWAIVFALVPLIHPVVRDFARSRREKARAAETAPLYKSLDDTVEKLQKPFQTFTGKYFQYPTTTGAKMYPLITREGTPLAAAESDRIKPPIDPFDTAAVLRFQAVGTSGTLILSEGQNKIVELPAPVPNMDPFPNSPLAPIASTGLDWRLASYDPTNGALGGGDVVRWVGKGTRDEALRGLDAAWDRANGASHPQPITDKNANTAAATDAAAAQRLLEDKDYLAALALSSRAIVERKPYAAEWKDDSLTRAGMVQGLALFELGHPRAACDALIDYLLVSPNDTRARYYLAASMYLAGNAEEAKVHFAAAAQIEPQSPLATEAARCLDALEHSKSPPIPVPAYRQQR